MTVSRHGWLAIERLNERGNWQARVVLAFNEARDRVLPESALRAPSGGQKLKFFLRLDLFLTAMPKQCLSLHADAVRYQPLLRSSYRQISLGFVQRWLLMIIRTSDRMELAARPS